MEHDHSQHPAAIPAQMPPESQLADVAELFKIFGDLTRVRIIFVLFQHEECVRDIAQKLEMTQSAISHQLVSSTQGKQSQKVWQTKTEKSQKVQ